MLKTLCFHDNRGFGTGVCGGKHGRKHTHTRVCAQDGLKHYSKLSDEGSFLFIYEGYNLPPQARPAGDVTNVPSGSKIWEKFSFAQQPQSNGTYGSNCSAFGSHWEWVDGSQRCVFANLYWLNHIGLREANVKTNHYTWTFLQLWPHLGLWIFRQQHLMLLITTKWIYFLSLYILIPNLFSLINVINELVKSNLK